MWNVKVELIPVIIGATGTISKSLRRHLNNTTGKNEIEAIQTTAVLGTAHILWGVLCESKVKVFHDRPRWP